jgi:hypothetical protein
MNMRAGRVPRVMTWTVLLLGLVVLLLLALPRVVAARKTIETRFRESLVEAKSNDGDVLEVATVRTEESVAISDAKALWFLNIPVNLGKTVSSLRVPVTYRFHVLLSGEWHVAETRETVSVHAPAVRPSLPPAPDISAMDVQTERGWFRFNAKDVEQQVRALVTDELNSRAARLSRTPVAADLARRSVTNYLKGRMSWLSRACRHKVFVVRFQNEAAPSEDAREPR